MGIECCKCSKLYDGKKASIYSKNTEVSDYKKAPHESRNNTGISTDEIKLRTKNAVGVGVEEPLGCWASCFPWAWKKEKENPAENPKSDDTAVLLVGQLTDSSSKLTSQELSERDPDAVELNNNVHVVHCEIEKYVETEDTCVDSTAKQVKVRIVQQAKSGMCEEIEVVLAESTSKVVKDSRTANAKTETCEEKEDILAESTSNTVKASREQKAKVETCEENEDIQAEATSKVVKASREQKAKVETCEENEDIQAEATSKVVKASRGQKAKVETCEENEDIQAEATSKVVKASREQKAKAETCEEKEGVLNEPTLKAVKVSREQLAESVSLDLEQRSNAVRQTNFIDEWMNGHTVHDAKLSKSTMSARDAHRTKKGVCIGYVKASTSKSWSRHLIEHNIGHDLKTSGQKYKGQRVIGAVVSPQHEREVVENILTEEEGVQMHRQNGIESRTMNKHGMSG